MTTRTLTALLAGALLVLPPAVPAAAGPHPAAALAPACPQRTGPYARCLTLYAPGARADAAGPTGLGATDLASAYRIPTGKASTATVAVSIAFDAPNLEADLATYRTQYGLPACTTANGCFRKVNQDGAATPLPPPDTGWAVESTLDVSMISAGCPSCHILVVEGNSNAYADLAATEDTAVRLGAHTVSNSYGGPESNGALRYAGSYRHDGVHLVVSSGDSGFGPASYPASLATVTAVGGTTLTTATGDRGWAETAWSRSPWQGGGSGCSAYVTKPSWQHDPHCSMRTVADVSAAADNIAIHVTDVGGWITVAGTSASAPLIAGLYGLADNPASGAPGYPYRHAGSLFDVTSGGNDGYHGRKCGGDYLCVAAAGYDAPTGLGTPNGLGAF